MMIYTSRLRVRVSNPQGYVHYPQSDSGNRSSRKFQTHKGTSITTLKLLKKSSSSFQTHKGTSITSLLSCIYSPELSFKPTRVRPLPTRNRVVIVLYMLFLQNIFRRPPITLSPLGGSTEIVGFSVSLLYFRKLWVVVTAVVYGVVVCYLYDLEIVEPVVFSSF